MLGLKVPKREAQAAKARLIAADALDASHRPSRDEEFVYFPVKRRVPGVLVRCSFEAVKPHAGSLREILSGELNARELDALSASFDVVGDIAILEIRPELRAKEKLIARALLETNTRVRTVLRKDSAMLGEYRVRRLKWLAGRRTTEALYRENECVMRVDLAKDYFSPRLSTERLRIASLAKKGERILVLFAGVGPYALEIAKRVACKVVAIELNPHAARLLKENVVLNKLKGTVKAVRGDVRRVVPRDYARWADRIAMPLPHTGENFLEVALAGARKNCVIHFYCFAPSANPFAEPSALVKRKCREAGYSCRIIKKRVVRPYSPLLVQTVVDFKVVRLTRSSR
ncbi:MAG: class I SAM-dependent methyltransferase family protein [Candidatus Micrarchaeia archaeon]